MQRVSSGRPGWLGLWLLSHLAHVLVVLVTVRLLGTLELRLGARAQCGDQLAVVASEAQETAVHRFVDRLAVIDGDILLDAVVVRLQARGALHHHFHILRGRFSCLYDRPYEGLRLGLRLGCITLGYVETCSHRLGFRHTFLSGDIDLNLLGRDFLFS